MINSLFLLDVINAKLYYLSSLSKYIRLCTLSYFVRDELNEYHFFSFNVPNFFLVDLIECFRIF
jgi:hypothetical protein